jgi:TolB-like protein
MDIRKSVGILIAALALVAGCTSVTKRDFAQPSKTKDQFTRIRRVAVFPLENYSNTKDAEKMVDSLLATALREEEVFDQVEDTRFVRDTMKKLKITNTDILEKEVIKKFGDEMNVQGILCGKVLQFGPGISKDSPNQMTIDLSLVDPSTGLVLWAGNVSVYGGLTLGKVFGVTEGKTPEEVARDGIRKLASSLADEIQDARKQEKKGIVAALKQEQDQEAARLEKLKAETGRLQGEIDKARSEARSITDNAARSAEQVKADLELQKATLEAEKSKTQAAQQEIDQEKLKVEVERKKIAEDLKRVEDEKKALEEARKKAAEPAAAPAPVPAPPPAPAPAPEPQPAAPPGQ